MQVPERVQEYIDSLEKEDAVCDEQIADLRKRIASYQGRQEIVRTRLFDANMIVGFFKEAEPVPVEDASVDDEWTLSHFNVTVGPGPEMGLYASEDVDKAELTARERIKSAALEARGTAIDIAERAGVGKAHAASELSKLARKGVIAHVGQEWGDPGAFS